MVVAAEVAGERRPAMPLLTMPLLVIHSWQLGVGVVLTRNVQSVHACMDGRDQLACASSVPSVSLFVPVQVQ